MGTLTDGSISRPSSRRDLLDGSRPSPQRSRHDLRDTSGLLSKQPPAPDTDALLRDLPYTLQGLDSTHLPFSDDRTLRLPRGLPIPLLGLLNVLAEPALLYRQLAAYVTTYGGGLVGQSLRAAIGEELRSYLGLVATLESQIRKALGEADNDTRQAQVTLKKCVVWTRDATLGLRLMSTIVEQGQGQKGGPLITLVHRLSTSHGDPFVHTFATRLLHKISKPFYNMLEHWIFRGVLEDPFEEFFVTQIPEADQSSPTSIWTDIYQLKHDMLPSIISSDIASRVFLIGKSLNFIRSSCSDAGWVESYTAAHSRDLTLSDPATLNDTISSSYKFTAARVLELMSSKFQLFEHLSALKKYLLLGQGDFIALLLESLSGNLDSPANAQYRHHLTSALDHSIRNSNAQYESSDITRRLDARMLELSHGEIGWDVFTLEYRMDSPLDVVVDAWSQKQYLKIFNFLWRIKRVEFTLAQIWGRCMTGARGVLRFTHEAVPRGKERDLAAGPEDDALREIWRRVRGGLAAMIHFVGQLQYYILFEVIESGWEALKAEMAKPSATLDTLIAAHRAYLHSITRKGLLAASAPSSSSSTTGSTLPSSSTTAADFTSQLHELLKLMLSYRDTTDALYSHSIAAYTTRGQAQQPNPHRRTARARTKPLIPIPGDEDSDDNGSRFTGGHHESSSTAAGMTTTTEEIAGRLAELEDRFRRRVEALLSDLAYQQDTDMRFLGVAMNFNDVYRVARRRRAAGVQQQQQQQQQPQQPQHAGQGPAGSAGQATPAPGGAAAT